MVMTTIIMIIKKAIIKIIVVITLITITSAVIAIIKNSNNKGKSVKRWFANWNKLFYLSLLLSESSSIVIFDYIINKSFKI